jgi:hypothetical protein
MTSQKNSLSHLLLAMLVASWLTSAGILEQSMGLRTKKNRVVVLAHQVSLASRPVQQLRSYAVHSPQRLFWNSSTMYWVLPVGEGEGRKAESWTEINTNLYGSRSEKTHPFCKANKSKGLKDKNLKKSLFLRKCLEKSSSIISPYVRPLWLDIGENYCAGIHRDIYVNENPEILPRLLTEIRRKKILLFCRS